MTPHPKTSTTQPIQPITSTTRRSPPCRCWSARPIETLNADLHYVKGRSPRPKCQSSNNQTPNTNLDTIRWSIVRERRKRGKRNNKRVGGGLQWTVTVGPAMGGSSDGVHDHGFQPWREWIWREERATWEREREREGGRWDERMKREKKSHHNSRFFVCLIQIWCIFMF